MRRSALFLLLAGCVENTYILDLKDYDYPPPPDLETRLRRFRSGEEPWHGDPKQVADLAIRFCPDPNVTVPWRADPFNPRYYEVLQKPEWGTYVVRGYTYPDGEMRYRVKIRKHEEIWYPTQVSRHKIVRLPEDRAHDHHH